MTNPSNCRSLYAKVASCYDLNGQQKDQCFKRIAGFTKAKVTDEASANNKEALNKYEKGETTAEQTSESISLIVQIKQKILQNQTKSHIKPFMQELKAKLRELNL